MKVFISWSGSRSHNIARSFKDWIRKIIQAAEPYLSSEDIYKGAKWEPEMSGEVAKSPVGIIILTPENRFEPWIYYEAGALGRDLEKSWVCPILFELSPSELGGGPFAHIQATSFNKEEILKLLKTINEALGDPIIAGHILEDAFNTHWHELEKEVKESLSKEEEAPGPEELRTANELLKEVLDKVRGLGPDPMFTRVPEWTLARIITKEEKENAKALWELLVAAIAKHSEELALNLVIGQPITYYENRLGLLFKDTIARDAIQHPETLALIQDEAIRLAGHPTQVVVITERTIS